MRKTSAKKFRAKVKEFKTWIRSNRHTSEVELMRTVRSKLVGHYNYYGVSDNIEGITSYLRAVKRLLLKWRNRRSQKIHGRKVRVVHYPKPTPETVNNRESICKENNSVRKHEEPYALIGHVRIWEG
ncbi:maturase [Paenibacillus frigoriresistens]|uniref:group II intron maturase-specific domain-containing protein n=1 Tax=Paenibacillus alginolyticus TaxID=59839 RepID=UPI001564BD84|nr:group II intron maturase-specific domain-containing protein [Paenibacillus frigoriresistens]NRF90583.1 maturase [Paenibacillus frigoriresistens]